MTTGRRQELLYGNEAIARGAWEASVRVATAYPGTPSTEILEAMAKYDDVYVEWSANEKVALEVAIGASIGGARAMACMKHVGVNVAADPLLTVSYMGVTGGLVLVTADDPGMHSSQNEQDNRWYGKLAFLPVLEPSDSAEALAFTKSAFELSERFNTPVLLRTVTRISHARSPVDLGDRSVPTPPHYTKQPAKFVAMPAHARALKPKVLERIERLTAYAETAHLNRVEWPAAGEAGRAKRGFVTGGMAYSFVKECFPDDPVFKLGLSYPVPREALLRFATQVDRLYVVEELDPFWETELCRLGLHPVGKEIFPSAGELSAKIVRAAVEAHERALAGGPPARPAIVACGAGDQPAAETLPGRPPVLCPGCPHRGAFYVLSQLGLIVTGDIGCYTLGVMPPLAALDTCICMGASLGVAIGLRRSLPPEQAAKVVAVIGDSTFIHSGMTPLIDAAYNQTGLVVVIMDNGTTAMTGHQGNPASGIDARRRPGQSVSLEQLALACGAGHVEVVDPGDLKATEAAIRAALAAGPAPAVVITRRPCALIDRSLRGREPVQVDLGACIACGLCLQLGCPALAEGEGGNPVVQTALCVGCDLCVQVCPQQALLTPRGGERA